MRQVQVLQLLNTPFSSYILLNVIQLILILCPYMLYIYVCGLLNTAYFI